MVETTGAPMMARPDPSMPKVGRAVGPARGHQVPVPGQLAGGKHLRADLEEAVSHLDARLPELPRQELGRQQRIQLRHVRALVEEADGKPVRVRKLLCTKCSQPHPKRPLIVKQPALDIGLKAKRVRKSPGGQGGIGELLQR